MQEILENSPSSFSKHVAILGNAASHCLRYFRPLIPIQLSSYNN